MPAGVELAIGGTVVCRGDPAADRVRNGDLLDVRASAGERQGGGDEGRRAIEACAPTSTTPRCRRTL
jgi:hypothetical protein